MSDLLWYLFTSPLDGLNAMYRAITLWFADIIPQLTTLVVNMLIAAFYPASWFVFIVTSFIGMLYEFFVPIINTVILIGNLPYIILTSYFAFPTPWTTILLMSVTLSLSVRIYRWMRTIPVIAYIFKTGDGGS